MAVTAWHLALSNLIGVEVPHDLLALWVFPERGGVVLLAPQELGKDKLDLVAANPFVSQHDLFLLEERIRHAGYRSVLAVPIRVTERDLGLAVFAHLQSAKFGAVEAMRLTAMMRQAVPTFRTLSAAPPLAFAAGPAANVTAANAPEAVARAAAEGENGPEVLRLVSGVLQVLVPHDRVEVALPGATNGTWALLSGSPDGKRWGESTGEVSQTITGFIARAAEDATIAIGDLRALGLSWPAYRETRSNGRIHALIGVKLSVAGSEDSWLLLGGAAPDIYRAVDREVLKTIAPVMALRVQGLRAGLSAEVARSHAASSQMSQSRAARIASSLAGTAHWGDAVTCFVKDVRESLGYQDARFILRFGDGRLVIVPAGDLRPLSSLPSSEIDGSGLESLFEGIAPFMVAGETGSDLLVPLRVAGRVVGALELIDGTMVASGH
ncbi:MAG TPA: hypothetical protein VJU15_00740, partial [Gemmatimonadales bacterium]|nr:hypothetical protein [Gemmatimonadales bacterium]